MTLLRSDMTNDRCTELPNYSNPPVIETILGVQFEPLQGLQNAYLGAFWKTLGEDWPTVADAPPLEPQFERFESGGVWQRIGIQLKLMEKPTIRLQIKNRTGDRMIQIQNGRLHFNWLGENGGAYPRYEAVREGMQWLLSKFQAFVAEERLGRLQANQWEVTYLNHIAKGTTWETPKDWTFFLPLSGRRGAPELLPLDSFGGEWHFEIPPKQGRLHVEWRHGKQADPKGSEVIVLTFTARGPISDEVNDLIPVLQGLDLGRATIVRSFKDMMSDSANSYWGFANA